MLVKTALLGTTPGAFKVVLPGIAFAYMVAVHRSGKVYAIQNTNPSGMGLKCKHFKGGLAQIRFSPDNKFNPGETVFLIYKVLIA